MTSRQLKVMMVAVIGHIAAQALLGHGGVGVFAASWLLRSYAAASVGVVLLS